MEKLGIAAVFALMVAALIAVGSAIAMFWFALTYENFHLLAPIGYWDSFVYTAITAAFFSLLNPVRTQVKAGKS